MRALYLLNSTDVGERLRISRESAKLTQNDVAEKINIARTTIVAIEKGERRVRFSELQELTEVYGTSINALLRLEATHVDVAPRFRKLDGTNSSAVGSAAQLLNNLSKADLELENLLGRRIDAWH